MGSKYLANHLLYMTGVFNNIYMIMAQSVILARQFIMSREAEASLEEKNAVLDSLNRMKSDFLANISHEISTPLTVISGYAQQTQMEIESGEVNDETAGNLRIVQSEAHRLADLAHQVLYTAKNLQTGVAIIPVQTAEILKRAAALCEPILAKNGNRLEIHGIPDCPAVSANLDMILQVLLNLCTNSNRHTKNGTLSVSVKRAGDFAEFTVEDNGSGIAPELLPDVFARGVSGDDKSGLGLAICKDVLRQHGGGIDLYNKHSGGACAVFTLPLAEEVK
jgi:signal transduction histidine kinase